MYCLKNITKVYSQGEQSMTALSDVCLEFEKYGLVSIIGESGSGKTTLLNVLAGFDKVTQGEIYFQEKKLSSYNDEEWNSYYSSDVGFVFQDYNVIEELTIWDNVALALDILDISNDEKYNMISSALLKVGLFDIREKKVNKLSGGQKQRVAIARAYVKEPKVILADEPTGNLDYENSIKIFEMLKNISKDTLVFVVTHNQSLGEKYSDRIIKLCDGKVVSDNICAREKYDIKICYGNIQEEIDEISDITRFATLNPNKENEYTISVKKIETLDCIIESSSLKKDTYNKKSLQIKKILELSKKILSKRYIRQILTIGIFTITILLMLFMVDIVFYNEDTVVVDYLNKYNEKDIIVEYPLDSLYTYSNNGNTACVTKEIKQFLIDIAKSDVFYQFDSVVFSNTDNLSNVEIEKEEKQFSYFADVRVLSDEFLCNNYFVEGLKDFEFIITEALAQELGITKDDICKSYYVDGNKVRLKGMVHGDKPFVYVSESYMERIEEKNSDKNISVSGNFLRAKSLIEYTSSCINIGAVDKNEYTRLEGRIPRSGNEIILSYSFVNENLGNMGEIHNITSKTYSLKDLYSEKYGNAMSEKMNLYDYLGKEIIVVGLADFDGDILVEENVFQKILDDYYDVFCYDKMGCFSDKWYSTVKNIHKNGLRISDDNLKNVYMLVDIKPVLLKYIVLILLMMLILTIFLMISLIGYSIKDNSKTIGILYAIGINKKNIKNIFMIGPIKAIITAFSIAILLMIMVVKYINAEYCNSLIGRTYEILPISIHSVLIVLIVTMIIGVVTVVFPLKEMEKRTIIENIKN